MERNPCKTAILAQRRPCQRQRRVELAELVVDGDTDRLERALGGMAAAEAAGAGIAALTISTSSLRRLDRRRARSRTIARAIAVA